MSGNLKAIYKEILINRDLEENIPKALRIAAEKYYTSAMVKLAMDYYTYYEMYCDEKEHWSEDLAEYIETIKGIISEGLLDSSTDGIEGLISRTDEIRKRAAAKMEAITRYVDLFELYEYALNRVEYRFKEMDRVEDDEAFARKVLRYIFESDDNSVINNRIKEIISQLPVRITKEKYYDFMRSGIGMLAGSGEDTWRTMFYMVRSSAALDINEEIRDVYPELWERKEELERLDFKAISREEYEAAASGIDEATRYLEIEGTAFISLVEIINGIYTLLLCIPYNKNDLTVDSEIRKAALDIIRGINEAFLKEGPDTFPIGILDKFTVLEGVQEDMELEMMKVEDILYHINERHGAVVKSLNEDSVLESLLRCRILNSGSLFVDLNDPGMNLRVNNEGLGRETDKLIKELDDKFRNTDRMIARAIMANTIDKVPVFFDSRTEVMDYILYSLKRCTDIPEKYASMEIIRSIMEW